MKCSICRNKIVGSGNRTAPLKRKVACDSCHRTVVLPIRIYLADIISSHSALIIRADDTIDYIFSTNDTITLEEYQAAVGGNIEFYPIANEKYKFIVNEEGLLFGLPINRMAKEIFNIEVVGDLVISPHRLFE